MARKTQVSQATGGGHLTPVTPSRHAPTMQISYLVLYVTDPEASAAWYTDALGLRFTEEQHGVNGPVHYSTALGGGTVLELFSAGDDHPVTRTRIGLVVPDPFGVRPAPTLITDPDGNRIEVTARAASA
ncbi:VOC family protein [Tsukamurella paurometabola]|uniref:VOC family protein n=2 Tax=Mycobacteriales TaxID=85007 RepID=A0ABS5NF36_TSUPA|nr:VOC family protein [Tsukamurella paurometabola]MBS4102914.1 VOC family protein [Tsukamurella paurometabola]